jgi:hypothetical protein
MTVIWTRPGRWQVCFDQPERPIANSKRHRLGTKIDVQGVGGMVVGPGSVIDGHARHLVAGDLGTVPPLKHWLDPLVRGAEPRRPPRFARPGLPWFTAEAELRLRRAARTVAAKREPGRNNTLNTEALKLRRALPALGYERIEEELFAAAEENGLVSDPKDGPASVRATIGSGLLARDRRP